MVPPLTLITTSFQGGGLGRTSIRARNSCADKKEKGLSSGKNHVATPHYIAILSTCSAGVPWRQGTIYSPLGSYASNVVAEHCSAVANLVHVVHELQ